MENKKNIKSRFEESPVSLWEEDFSEIKKYFNDLKSKGVEDLEVFFDEYPEELEKCVSLIKITDVNSYTLELFEAPNKETLFNKFPVIFLPETIQTCKRGLCKLFKGSLVFEDQIVTKTLSGKIMLNSIKWNVVSKREDDLSKVIVSIADVTEYKKSENLLLKIADKISSKTGIEYFNSLVKFISEEFQMEYVIVGKFIDSIHSVNTIAFYSNGKIIDNLTYDLKDTPCDNVIGKTACVYMRDVQNLFPKDKNLLDMKAESYSGIPLFSSDKKPLGIICTLSPKELEPKKDEKILSILKILAPRTSAEFERIETQNNLIAEKNKAVKFLEVAKVMILALDENGNVLLINEKGCEILECKKHEVIGKNWFENFLYENDKEKVEKIFKDLMDGEIVKTKYHENKIISKSGRRKLIGWNNAILQDEKGSIIGTLSSGEDITEKKRTENILLNIAKGISSQIGKKFFYSLVSELSKTLNVNYAYLAEFFGEDMKQARTLALIADGKIIDNLEVDLHGTPCENLLEKDFFSVKQDVTKIFPNAHVIKQMGCESYIGVSLKDSEGKRIGILSIINRTPLENITFFESILKIFAVRASAELERSRIENEKEKLFSELTLKNQELQQILYITSHDLRAPLVNIQGFSDEMVFTIKEINALFEKSKNFDDIKDDLSLLMNDHLENSLSFIKKSTIKMSTLLSGFLAISRIGKRLIQKSRLDMNKLIKNVLESFEFQIKKLHCEIELANLPPCTGDEHQLNQVFSNLIDNAMKYMRNDIQIKLTISGTQENGKSVYCVEDNGQGIPKEKLSRVFDIFYQLNPISKSGEGLGLSIVKKIVGMHGGEVWVKSEENKGSKFYVSLPS